MLIIDSKYVLKFGSYKESQIQTDSEWFKYILIKMID